MAKFQKASVLEIKASSVSHGKEPRNKNTIKTHRDKQGVRNEEGKQKRKRNERVTLTVGDWWKIRAQSMLNKRKAEHRVECGQNWCQKELCQKGSPMKAMPFFKRSSGSLGFSEAWPQPAHTAYKRTHYNSLLKFILKKQNKTRLDLLGEVQ